MLPRVLVPAPIQVHGNHGRSHANASANSTTPATGFQSASGSNSHTTITSNSNGSSDNTTSSSSITISSSSMDSNESGDGGDGKHAAGVTSGPPDGAAAAAVAVAWDSVGKLHAVLQLCGELGVEVRPRRVGRLAVVPLLAWHHQVGGRVQFVHQLRKLVAWVPATCFACCVPVVELLVGVLVGCVI